MRFGPVALYILFYFSGAAALGFQMTWSRMFAAGLGQEMPAVLAVVAAIFGGMALGAWTSERALARNPRPGRWYGWIELLMGVWGLGTIALVPWANGAALNLTGLEASAFRQWLIAFVLPCLTLLPATTAMGATFPAMERFLAPLTVAGRCVGGLYAANTFGAVTGVLASTFLLVPRFGFTTTVTLVAIVSLLCGAAALALDSRFKFDRPAMSTAVGLQRSGFRLGFTLSVTGLLGIGYEVLGVRVLAQVLENTIYTFAAVLAVYLLGTAGGAAVYQIAERRLRSASALGHLLVGTSIASLLGVWVLSQAPLVYGRARTLFPPTPLGVWCAEVITAGLVFLWPTLLMGATFSHLVQSAKEHTLGLGRALAWNTLGSAFAPLIFGVLLLPGLGAKGAFLVVGLMYLGLAWPLFAWQRVLAAVLLLLVFTLPTKLRFVERSPGDKLLAYREGASDSVAVLEHADGHRSLVVNNRFMMGGTGAALAERRHASIPLLLHPAPKRALFLGLGTGITFAAAGAHASLRADGVELVPEIVEALPWFAPHNTLPAPPGQFRIFTADARRYAGTCSESYDVIVADLFHPARDGAGALYSRQHFRALGNRLAPGGLLCQWLPLYQLDEPVLRVIVRTFLDVFPQTQAFLLRFNVDTPVLGLIGRLEPQRYSGEYYQRRVADPALREALAAEQLRDGYHLFGCFLAGPDALRRFSDGAALNTDDRPIVLFAAPHFNLDGRAKPYGRLLRLLEVCSSDVGELFQPDTVSGEEFSAQLAAFIEARNTYLKGFVAEIEGYRERAIDAYVESARLSPFFMTGYAHGLTLAMQQAKSNPAAARHLLERLAAAQPNRPAAAELLKRLAQ